MATATASPAKKSAKKKKSAGATPITTTEPSLDDLKRDAIQHRYEIVTFHDCAMGNANGDPENGNASRVDDSTGQGLMTPMAYKRKIRNMLMWLVMAGQIDPERYDIYVKDRGILNEEHRKGYRAIGLPDDMDVLKDLATNGEMDVFPELVRRWMCMHYADIRWFGGMMQTKVPVRSQRGPVQVSMSVSCHPITQWEMAITRVAVTTQGERESGSEHMIGRTNLQPYALFRTNMYISAMLAQQTGFSDADLEILFRSLKEMFEHDHAASTGDTGMRKIYAFKHATRLGNARACELLERVSARLVDPSMPPRKFSDYVVTADATDLPEGVELIEVL